MTDESFDALMRDAATTYNRPPDVVPLDDMWDAVERRVLAARDTAGSTDVDPRFRTGARLRRWSGHRGLQAAALLVLGIGVGRVTAGPRMQAASPESSIADAGAGVLYQYAPITDQYLGQAAALLIDLPRELRMEQADTSFTAGAHDLLLQTRLLLDSPAIADPLLRTLLEDLEVVLVQLVRLQADPDPVRSDLLQESLEESDVIPRLRSAVAEYITD